MKKHAKQICIKEAIGLGHSLERGSFRDEYETLRSIPRIALLKPEASSDCRGILCFSYSPLGMRYPISTIEHTPVLKGAVQDADKMKPVGCVDHATRGMGRDW